MKYHIKFDREEHGRWIADTSGIPDVTLYGEIRVEALRKDKVLTLRVLAKKLEHEELEHNVESIVLVTS